MSNEQFDLINAKLDALMKMMSETKPPDFVWPTRNNKPLKTDGAAALQAQARDAVKKLTAMRYQLQGQLTMMQICEILGVEHNNTVINALGNRLLTLRGCTKGRTKLQRYYVFRTKDENLL